MIDLEYLYFCHFMPVLILNHFITGCCRNEVFALEGPVTQMWQVETHAHFGEIWEEIGIQIEGSCPDSSKQELATAETSSFLKNKFITQIFFILMKSSSSVMPEN